MRHWVSWFRAVNVGTVKFRNPYFGLFLSSKCYRICVHVVMTDLLRSCQVLQQRAHLFLTIRMKGAMPLRYLRFEICFILTTNCGESFNFGNNVDRYSIEFSMILIILNSSFGEAIPGRVTRTIIDLRRVIDEKILRIGEYRHAQDIGVGC